MHICVHDVSSSGLMFHTLSYGGLPGGDLPRVQRPHTPLVPPSQVLPPTPSLPSTQLLSFPLNPLSTSKRVT